MSRRKAEKLMRLANELNSEGREEEAIKVYKQAINMDKNWSVPYYDLGLVYKYKLEWEKSYKLNATAARLDRSDQAAWWNMGIAATALSNWKMAKKAWRGFGMNIPHSLDEEELKMKIGMTPVRLKENREVIWVERIDPARGTIENIPTEESNRRYKDILLHDGAPNGQRMVEGQLYNVFDELEIWQASDYQSFELTVSVVTASQSEELKKMCEAQDMGFENWTNSLRHVCRQCSEGLPHKHHDEDLLKEKIEGEFHLAIAAKEENTVNEILDVWQRKHQVLQIEMGRFI